jgi:hypothetical protein
MIDDFYIKWLLVFNILFFTIVFLTNLDSIMDLFLGLIIFIGISWILTKIIIYLKKMGDFK